LKSATDQI